MSAEQDTVEPIDVCSPRKQLRTEVTVAEIPPTPMSSPIKNTAATCYTTVTTTATATATTSTAEKETTATVCPPCLDAPKDSIIAQLLAGSESDFTETALCPPGVFFDDTCYTSTSAATSSSFSPHSSWSGEQSRTPTSNHTMMLSSAVTKELRSLLVTMESRGCALKHKIEQVVTDHELVICPPGEAVALCNERLFQLIWLQLPVPPSEDVLAAITGIRYNSKYNKKTIQLGISLTLPETDLNLHGIDEILLEPVSKATIRQKYFDWTSVKLTPDYSLSMRDAPLSPTTPDSSVSTESNIELSLSSLTSDTTNDSGIQGEVDMADLKPPTPFLFPQHTTAKKRSTGSPALPPTWCRAEHATKEKHRRERIKDSCDQLRVLLPYVRGRKTDMASILEMTVDYLKIVNSKLPHEFHAHVLDVMTKGDDSPEARGPRAPLPGKPSDSAKPNRGGRGPRREDPPSPIAPNPSPLLDSAHGRMLTRSLSRATTSTPVSIVSNTAKGNGTVRGKATKRGVQQGRAVSPSPPNMGGLYLSHADFTDKGGRGRDDGGLGMPAYLAPPHHHMPAAHMFGEGPAPPHCYPPPPLGGPDVGHAPVMTSGEHALAMPRLFASGHMALDQSFLAPPPLATRYTVGGGSDGAGAFGADVCGTSAPTPASVAAYYHYFSLPEVAPAYSLAGGVSGASSGCPPPQASLMGGDYLATAPGPALLTLPPPRPYPAPSPFLPAPPRLPLNPPRPAKDDQAPPTLQATPTLQPQPPQVILVGSDNENGYGIQADSTPKTTN